MRNWVKLHERSSEGNGAMDRRQEDRRFLLARVTVQWGEGAPPVTRTRLAMLEDISPHGACLRTNTAIAAGTRVAVTGYRTPFTGSVRYCRPHVMGYLVGLQCPAAGDPTPGDDRSTAP